MKSDFIKTHNAKFSAKLLAILVCFISLFITRNRVFYVLDTKIIGGVVGDSGLYYWLAKSFVRNIFENSFFQTSMYYPYGYTLAWSDNFILPSAFINFLSLFFSFDVSYNLCFIFTWLLNGFSCFLLLYFLTGSFIYSVLPSVLFCINSSLGFSMGHPQLQFIFFIPLGIYYFLRFIAYERKRDSFYLGLTILLSFLTTVYYALFLCLVIFFLYIAIFLLKPKYVLKYKHIINLLKGFILGFLPITIFLVPYFNVKKTFSKRALYEAYAFSSNLSSYFTSSPLSVFYKNFNFSHNESVSFVGFIPIISLLLLTITILKGAKVLSKYLFSFSVLFLIGLYLTSFITEENYISYYASFFLWSGYLVLIFMLIKLKNLEYNDNLYILSNRGLILSFLFLLVSLVFLSLGPLGSEVAVSRPTGLYSVMYHIFPGVNAMRATGRIGLVVILVMYILSSLNFYLISRKSKFVSLVFVLCFLLNFAEQKVVAFQIGNKPKVKYEAIIAKLNALPSKYAIIYLPIVNDKNKNSEVNYANMSVSYMIDALSHRHPIINGYSGQRGRSGKEYRDKMRDFPDKLSVATLTNNYNLKYVFYDGNKVDGFDAKAFEEKVSNFKNDLKIIAKQGNAYLIEYIGSVVNEKGYYLMVPKYYNKIDINIKTKGSPKEMANKAIMIKNNNNDAYVGSITSKGDGKWIKYKVDLSKTFCDNKVSPYRLVFSNISNGQKVYIKHYD